MKKIMIFCLIFLLIFAKYTYAKDNTDLGKCLFSIQHEGSENYFHKKARPGEIVEINFQINNETEKELSNFLLIYDSLTAVNGGNRVLNPENQICEQTASWFNKNKYIITLKPGCAIRKKLFINVPEKASPGLYTAILALYTDGGVSTMDGHGKNEELSFKINSSYSTTLAVVIEVDGEMERKILPAEGAHIHVEKQNGKTFMMIPLQNRGNTYEFPNVGVRVKNSRDETVCDKNVQMNIFYRQTDTYAAIDVTGFIKKGGQYYLETQVDYGEEGDKQQETAKYEIEAQKEIIRNAQKTRILKDKDKSSASSGYLIIERNIILWIVVAFISILSVSALVYVFYRRRR